MRWIAIAALAALFGGLIGCTAEPSKNDAGKTDPGKAKAPAKMEPAKAGRMALVYYDMAG